MSLSSYIVSTLIKDKQMSEINFPELKNDCRSLAAEWWKINQDVVSSIKTNFEKATKKSFKEHENSIMNSYADHYAEKLIISCVKDSKLEIMGVEVDENVVETIKHTTQVLKKNVILASGHLGAVEAICPVLSNYGLKTSALINFKTEVARETLAAQIKERGWNIDMMVVDDMFFPRLRAHRKDPKVLLTVIDAFEKWDVSRKVDSTTLFDKECHLDSIIDRMARFLDADIYWTVMDRIEDGNYKLRLTKMEKEESGLYVARLFKQWESTIQKNPSLYYEWDSLDLLFNY